MGGDTQAAPRGPMGMGDGSGLWARRKVPYLFLEPSRASAMKRAKVEIAGTLVVNAWFRSVEILTETNFSQLLPVSR